LNLFDEREIRDDGSWNGTIPRRLEEFVKGLSQNVRYELRLDAHSPLAFAAGHCLNPRRGIDVATVQQVVGRELVWGRAVDALALKPKDVWKIEEVLLDAGKIEVALALNVTHDATEDVVAFAASACGIAVTT